MGYDIDKYIEKAYTGELLSELVIKILCLKLKEILINENNIIELKLPITLVGDIHG